MLRTLPCLGHGCAEDTARAGRGGWRGQTKAGCERSLATVHDEDGGPEDHAVGSRTETDDRHSSCGFNLGTADRVDRLRTELEGSRQAVHSAAAACPALRQSRVHYATGACHCPAAVCAAESAALGQ